jgi:hypothetical protein
MASAIISGYVLLRIHHSKVKDELTIRAGAEQLRLKQLAYEQAWEQMNAMFDYTQGFIDSTNWRLTRAAQTGLLLAGSQQVIELYFKIQRIMERGAETAEEMAERDKQLTGMLKDLWNVMRKDLYDAQPLAHENIRFYGPGRKTRIGLLALAKHRAALEGQGLTALKDFAEMDIEVLLKQLGAPRNELEQIKSMAARELELMRELKKAN